MWRSQNQYTSRTVPGAVDVLGLAMGNNSSLTVNSATPWRKGEYFRKEVSVANSTVAVWQAIAVAATGETTVNGNVFVPKTPESYTYDDDGNLTQDGRWDYTWDAENRLVKLVSRSGAPSGSEKAVLFTYDAKSRRISKTVSNWVSGAWQLESTNRFLYDGWNLIAVLNAQQSTINSFTWGLDLSGTLQGAGGVGGLLMLTNSGNGAHFCAYDGNGNVAALVKASDGTVSANYEYGPFGEALRVTGTMAKANPFRFSSKYQDEESDFLYYGYRSYNPSVGRWLSRDPIEELGGDNIYSHALNDPVLRFDSYGLSTAEQVEEVKKEIELIQKMHDLAKEMIENFEKCKGQCYGISSAVAHYCSCFRDAAGSPDDFADCICIQIPDDKKCKARARKAAQITNTVLENYRKLKEAEEKNKTEEKNKKKCKTCPKPDPNDEYKNIPDITIPNPPPKTSPPPPPPHRRP